MVVSNVRIVSAQPDALCIERQVEDSLDNENAHHRATAVARRMSSPSRSELHWRYEAGRAATANLVIRSCIEATAEEKLPSTKTTVR
jgi:hypothetical protein